MKRAHWLSLLVLLVALAIPLTASAETTVEREELTEHYVFAEWDYIDEAGNTVFVSVTGSKFSIRPGTAEAPTPIVSVGIFVSDPEGFPLVAATGAASPDFGDVLPPDFLTLDNRLTTAHLALANIPADESVSSGLVNVSVNLSWSGAGPVEIIHSQDTYEEDGVRVHTVFKSKARNAIVTGSVEIEGVNYTPVPSVRAQIQENRTRTVTTTRD